MLSFTYVLGDAEITAPEKDKTYSASGGSVKVPIKWEDSSDGDEDDEFSLVNAQTYSILLCTGTGSYPIECFETLEDEKEYTDGSDDFSYEADMDEDICDDGYYFFQVYISFGGEKATTHYTPRFELKDMSGSTKTLTVANTYNDDPPPDNTEGVDTVAVASRSRKLGYTEQTGKTRYAPIQTQPATKVTASTWKRAHETSEVTYYTGYRPSPNVLTTITGGWDYSVTSVHNYAHQNPQPSVKYNPRERITRASLSTAAKKRRWLD